jgi:hypothetical protein
MGSESTENRQGLPRFLVDEHIQLPRLVILSGGEVIVAYKFSQNMTLQESGYFCQNYRTLRRIAVNEGGLPMAIFGSKEDKEAKKMEKIREKMRQHRLDGLGMEYIDDCTAIFNELAGVGMMETGIKLAGASAVEQTKISYLHTLVEQNWIIIKQLDKISKQLDK